MLEDVKLGTVGFGKDAFDGGIDDASESGSADDAADDEVVIGEETVSLSSTSVVEVKIILLLRRNEKIPAGSALGEGLSRSGGPSSKLTVLRNLSMSASDMFNGPARK